MKINWRCQCSRCRYSREALQGIGPALVALVIVLCLHRLGVP